MTVLEGLLAAVVMAAGAAVQGAVGFGSNLVAAPLLVLIDPRLVPGPTNLAALVLNTAVLRRERAGTDRRELELVAVGLVPGTIVGAAALSATTDRSLGLLVAGVVVVGVAITASGRRVEMTWPAVTTAGFASGFGGTAVSIGGPPIALLHQHREGPVVRATLARVFLVSSVLSIIGLAAFGRFGVDDVASAGVLVPGSLVGFAVSSPLARRLDRGHTRRAILVLSLVSAIAVVVAQL